MSKTKQKQKKKGIQIIFLHDNYLIIQNHYCDKWRLMLRKLNPIFTLQNKRMETGNSMTIL